MKQPIYAIKDEHNGFTSVMFSSNDDTAKRDFREKSVLNQSMMITPEDFSVWKIGEFETETGKLINLQNKLLERGQKRDFNA